MKTSLALVVLLVLSCLQQVLMYEHNQNVHNLIHDCLDLYGVSVDAWELALNHQLSDPSHEMKCSAKCVLKRGEYIDNNGRLRDDAIPDDIPDPSILQAIKDCVKIEGGDSCDMAYKTILCLVKIDMIYD